VIALTANDQERDRAILQGFSVHLMEPMETSELVGAIANLTSAESTERYLE
jgi:CheY-like chemotaxis protein